MGKVCQRILYSLVLFFLVHLTQAQVTPVKKWDKTFGGSDTEYLFSVQQTSDGGYVVGGDSHSLPSSDRSAPSRGGNDYWVLKLDALGNKTWDKAFGTIGYDRLNSVQETIDGGFSVGGWAPESFNGDKSQGFNGYADYWILKLDNNGNKIWDKTYGGSTADHLWAMQQTTDGGFILGGESTSEISFDKSQGHRGNWDYWVVKIDANGNKMWDRTFGGTDRDELYALQQTNDGGYIIGGLSNSLQNGEKTQATKGGYDYWVLKLDANGNKIWDKTFGGNATDFLYSIIVTADGDYILGGYSESGISGDKSQVSSGDKDYWIIKIDDNGNKLWDKSFGGSGNDELHALRQTSDGGFILGGWSDSGISLDKSQASKGGFDFWVIKTDSSGQKLWDLTLGGTADERLYALQETSDKGFILGGWTESGQSGDVSQPSRGGIDFWLVRIIEPCQTLKATLMSNCENGSTTVSVSISGIQPDTSGLQSWTLTYMENGLSKSIKGTTSNFEITKNAVSGSIYTLESIVSGACITSLSHSVTVQRVPDAPEVKVENICGVPFLTISAIGAPDEGNYILYDTPTGSIPVLSSSTGTLVLPNSYKSVSYYIAATNNAGCEGERTFLPVNYDNCPPVFIPNIITQNHDGKNETFQPQNLPGRKWELQIHNRWGKQIYKTEDYQNTWPETEIASGTYYYLLINSKTKEKYKGWVEVMK